jgi:hypothetical protein
MEDAHLGAGARLSVFWQAGLPEHPIDTVDHVASYAKALVEALTAAGWQPRRLEVGLRVVPPRVVEIDVRGEVPRLDQASFAKLASLAIASCNLWAALDADSEIRLRPRLIPTEPVPAALPAAAAPDQRSSLPAPARAQFAAPAVATALPPPPLATPTAEAVSLAPLPVERPRLITRVLIAVVFGVLLGLFGLPRLVPQFELPSILPSVQPTAGISPTQAPQPIFLQPIVVEPTAVPTPIPTPTALPAPVAQLQARVQPTVALEVPNPTLVPTPQSAASSRVLFAERFVSPLPGWPHVPSGNTWFADGTYQLAARAPGQFVAVSVPLGALVSDVNVSARLRKTGGPAGGGYGLVVRNQDAAPLDGQTQTGRYIVFEVGDMGDIGIWQRDGSRWIDVLPWTHSDAVHPDTEPNEVAVSSLGSRLRFVVNGVEVANMTRNDLPSEGGVGVFVGGDMNEVNLEWLIVEAMGPFVALR